MATPTEMVAVLKTALESNAAIVSVVIDGLAVRYDRRQAMEELAKWEAREARAADTRPIATTIRLDGF